MRTSKWMMILAMMFLIGCSPKTNDGITPNQPVYTNNKILPDPFTLYNGSLVPGMSTTIYLPPPYTAPTFLSLADTTVNPINGRANIAFGLSNFNPGGNGSSPTGYWAAMEIIPNPVNNTPVTMDLSANSFTMATFYSQMVASAGVTTMPIGFAAANGTASVTLTTAWQPCTITLGSLTTVYSFFHIGFSNATDSAPLTVYVDDLQYQ